MIGKETFDSPFWITLIPMLFILTVVAILSNMLKIFTEDFTAYIFLRKTWVQYESVNHSAGEYAREEVHNNTMEGYWSVYRHWMNTYRGVSKKYLLF